VWRERTNPVETEERKKADEGERGRGLRSPRCKTGGGQGFADREQRVRTK